MVLDEAGGRNPYTFLLTITLLIGLFIGALLVSNLSTPSDAIENQDTIQNISPPGDGSQDLPVSEETLRKMIEYLPTQRLIELLGQSDILDDQPLDIGNQTDIGGLPPLSRSDQTTISGGSPFTDPQDTLHFTVEAPEPAYWRLTAYDAYAGDGWQRTAGQRIEMIPAQDQRDQMNQTITFTSAMEGIPGAWRITDTSLPDNETRYDVEDGVVRNQQNQDGDTVTVTSLRPIDDPTTLQQAGTDYPQRIEDRYTKLPDSVPERVHARTEAITNTSETPYEKARQIEQFMRSNYNYSLDIEEGSGQITDDLLFERDEAYCAHFATAMTVMLRSQDVPARYVTGYNSGTYNESRGAYDVKGMHAHAWVEVYFPEQGWVPFEPTPASSRAQAINNATEGDDASADEYDEGQSDEQPPEPSNTTDEDDPEQSEPFEITSISTNTSADTARLEDVLDIDVTISTGKTEDVTLFARYGGQIDLDWDQGVYTTTVTPAQLGCEPGDRVACLLPVEASNGTHRIGDNMTLYVDTIAPTITNITLNSTDLNANESLGIGVDLDGETNRSIDTVTASRGDGTGGTELQWTGDRWTGTIRAQGSGNLTVRAEDYATNMDEASSSTYTVHDSSQQPWYQRYKYVIVLVIAILGGGGVIAWRKGWIDKERLRNVLQYIVTGIRHLPDMIARLIVGTTRLVADIILEAKQLVFYLAQNPFLAIEKLQRWVEQKIDQLRSNVSTIQDQGAVDTVKQQLGMTDPTYETEVDYVWSHLRDASPLKPVSHYTPSEIGDSVIETSDVSEETVYTVVDAFHESTYSSETVQWDEQTLKAITEQLSELADGNDS